MARTKQPTNTCVKNYVKYYSGSNDEKMINKVCRSEYPSKFFGVAKEIGSTRATFCGQIPLTSIK